MAVLAAVAWVHGLAEGGKDSRERALVVRVELGHRLACGENRRQPERDCRGDEADDESLEHAELLSLRQHDDVSPPAAEPRVERVEERAEQTAEHGNYEEEGRLADVVRVRARRAEVDHAADEAVGRADGLPR